MKRCPRCNLNFPDSLKFCEACGGTLAEVASLRCPTCGEAAQPGWKFCVKCRSPLPSSNTGDLSRAAERPAPPPTVPLVSSEVIPSAPLRAEDTIRSSQQPTVTETQIRVRCRSCRNLVDEDSEFCEFCGASMFEDTVTTRTPPPAPVSPQPPPPPPVTPPQQTYRAPDHYQETYRPAPPPTSYTPTPPAPPVYAPAPDKTPPTLSMLSSYGTEDDAPPASFRWWHGLILLVFFLVIVGAVAAGGWWWWSNRKPAVQAQAPVDNANQPTNSSTSPSPRKPLTESSADSDLKRLQERVNNAKPSDSEILTSVKAAEDKYKDDYRFTYERAKLFGKGLISHDEAFDALYEGAVKAIDSGKNQEMLDDMTARKDSDFSRLSRGHRDWGVIMQALTSKDKAALKGHVH